MVCRAMEAVGGGRAVKEWRRRSPHDGGEWASIELELIEAEASTPRQKRGDQISILRKECWGKMAKMWMKHEPWNEGMSEGSMQEENEAP